MTILKDKIQKFEYTLRQEKLRQLRAEATKYHQVYKTSYRELKETLVENVKEFNPDRFYVNLNPQERKVLKRRGLLVNYLKTMHKMNDARIRHHSLNHKIKMVRKVDIPE